MMDDGSGRNSIKSESFETFQMTCVTRIQISLANHVQV